MPIVGLPKRLPEAGRIRIGEQVPTSNGRSRPKKLDTYRFTSGDREKIDHVAELYGGTVEPWTNDGVDQWQVTTTTDVLDVIVPPTDMAFTQWYELWSGGGCQRRCDGERMVDPDDRACMCDPDPDRRQCKATTRLSVMLARVQGAGLWRIECHGYYAAVELAASVDLIRLAAGRGGLLPASLRLDQRTVTRPGQPRRDFAVPVLDVKLPLAQIAAATAGALAVTAGDDSSAGELDAGVAMPAREDAATEEQRVAVRAACRQAGLDDDGRHDLLWLATNGRTESTRDPAFRKDDVDQVLVACELIAADHVRLSYTTEGDLQLLYGGDPEAGTGRPLVFPLDAAKVRAWAAALDTAAADEDPPPVEVDATSTAPDPDPQPASASDAPQSPADVPPPGDDRLL